MSCRHPLCTQQTLLSQNTVYLCGAGAGLNPGAELVLCDLAVIVPAVEQAERHRVFLPDKSASITKSLPAPKGVSCKERERPISQPASASQCSGVMQRQTHEKHCYLHQLLVPFHLITSNSYRLHAHLGVDHEC